MISRIRSLLTNANRTTREHGAPFAHQLRDMLFFRKALGASQSEFFAYRLWDRARAPAERLAYLTFEDHRRIENTLNPVQDQRLLLDKLAIDHAFKVAGVRIPSTAGVFCAKGKDTSMLSTVADLDRLSREPQENGLVFKPNDGSEGRGILVFDALTPGSFRLVDGRTMSTAELFTILSEKPDSTWKIERRLLLHPELAVVYPYVLSALRILSFRFRDGRVAIGPSNWCIAVDKSGVNNWSRGHLAAPIDDATGLVGKGAMIHDDHLVEHHPVTGVRFAGMHMPDWSAARDLVVRGHQALPRLGALGWDVAVTPDGPVVLEPNPWWGEKQLQVAHRAGMVRGAFSELLKDYGLGELIERREQLVAKLAGRS